MIRHRIGYNITRVFVSRREICHKTRTALGLASKGSILTEAQAQILFLVHHSSTISLAGSGLAIRLSVIHTDARLFQIICQLYGGYSRLLLGMDILVGLIAGGGSQHGWIWISQSLETIRNLLIHFLTGIAWVSVMDSTELQQQSSDGAASGLRCLVWRRGRYACIRDIERPPDLPPRSGCCGTQTSQVDEDLGKPACFQMITTPSVRFFSLVRFLIFSSFFIPNGRNNFQNYFLIFKKKSLNNKKIFYH